MIKEITDDIIALTVIVAGTVFAGWIVYLTSSIPEFFAVGFGMVMMHYFKREK